MQGYSAVPSSMIPGYSGGAPVLTAAGGSDPATRTVAATAGITTIDGTPSRVAAIGALAIAVLVGLHWAGFKFNVTAGN